MIFGIFRKRKPPLIVASPLPVFPPKGNSKAAVPSAPDWGRTCAVLFPLKHTKYSTSSLPASYTHCSLPFATSEAAKWNHQWGRHGTRSCYSTAAASPLPAPGTAAQTHWKMTNDTQKPVNKIHFPFCNSQLDLGNRSGYHVTVMHCFVLCQVS